VWVKTRSHDLRSDYGRMRTILGSNADVVVYLDMKVFIAAAPVRV